MTRWLVKKAEEFHYQMSKGCIHILKIIFFLNDFKFGSSFHLLKISGILLI